MFSVNGKNIKLSSNDTLDSLRGKISIVLGTLPPLLGKIPNNVKNGGKYTIEDPIFFMDNNTIKIRKHDDEPIKWIDINQDEIGSLDPGFLKKLYIIGKVQLTIEEFGDIRSDQAVGFAFFDLETELGQSEVDENVWLSRTTTIQTFKDMLSENLKNITKINKTIDTWDRVKPTFVTSQFVMNKINHQTEIPNSFHQNELMVFDSIKLNNTVIACFYQEMVKYNPDYIHLIDDYLNQDKILSKKLKASDIVRIMITINVPNSRTKYKMINIFVFKETITLSIETLLNTVCTSRTCDTEIPDLDTTLRSNSLKILIKNILIDMGQQEAYTQRKEKEFFYGSFSAAINVPIVVLKDLVTNDPNVYNISYINESALINTHKTNLNIFLKNNGPNEASKGRLYDIGVGLFERSDTVGTMVRLKKIRGGSDLKNKIDANMVIVNKILQYASGKVDLILKYYQKYINLKVEIQPLTEIIQEKETMLKVQAPEIFLANYTRLCNKPPIISEDLESDPSLTLKFPIYGESEPKMYKCPYPDYKYPGLRENTKLPNKDIFPFVPCCYKRPQTTSKNFKAYFNQEVHEQRINAGEIGKTLKILSPKRIGALPHKINKLLNYTTFTKFFRYGVPLSPSSCLDVLNMVTGKHQSNQIIRQELAKRAELCKGEFGTLSIKEITKKIMDPTTYINPRYFKGALEDYYQISYILFSKDEDDFSTYPNRFIRFICPLKKKVVFMVEHEGQEHVELIVDEETLTYVNRSGKTPIFWFEKGDSQVKKIFSLYKERFNYILYDIKNKGFVNLFGSERSKSDDEVGENHPFQIYPWELISPNGKIIKTVEPLNQYADSYGQIRLVEFQFKGLKFVGQFEPLPCLKLPIKPLEYFIAINGRLGPTEKETILMDNKWCNLYYSNLNISEGYMSPYSNFKKMKKMAEYILWSACHAYSLFYHNISDFSNGSHQPSVDNWIDNYTRVVDGFTYSKVTIQPLIDLTQFMVDSKFIFNSFQFQERIRFNLSLISPANLRSYITNIYHSFFKNADNFKVVFPAQLALSKQDYFQRTRQPYVLNILTTKNIQYLRSNSLYFIKELFGFFPDTLCLFQPSLEKLVEKANQLLYQLGQSTQNVGAFRYGTTEEPSNRYTLDETIMNVTVFDQKSIQQYSIGRKEPSINIIVVNINGTWFYGLMLPNIL